LQDGSAVLAIGMESGNIELWALGSNEDEASPCRLLVAVPSNLCHIADVKKIAFRPHDVEEEIVFASCGMDNGVRIFSVLLR
jgi:WD40 repeat protein